MAKIIGNPTVTPMAIPDWSQTNEARADFIKNKPTKLSEFVNDIDSLPSVVYTEIDNFTDGVCKIVPQNTWEHLEFDTEEGFTTTYASQVVTSDFYALCMAYTTEMVGESAYHQLLIFPDGNICCRYKYDWEEYNEETGDYDFYVGEWSKWRGLSVDYASLAGTASSATTATTATKATNANYATKADKDGNGNIITDTYATKEELADSKKWKTLLDVTLTEEQAGANELILAIEDVNAFVDARHIRIAMSLPIAEAKSANAFYSSMRIRDKNNSAYNQTFMQGYNKAGSANAIYYTTTQVEMFDFAYSDTYKKGFQSIFQLPNPHFTVSANSVGTASVSTGGFNPDAVRYYPPYLEIKTGAVTMEAGTHIFMEVCN